MKVFVFLALIGISSAAKLVFQPFTNGFSDCGGSRMTMAALTVDPDPVPVPGTVTVNAAGEFTQELTGDGLKLISHVLTSWDHAHMMCALRSSTQMPQFASCSQLMLNVSAQYHLTSSTWRISPLTFLMQAGLKTLFSMEALKPF